jgi:hypothetical protein
MEQAVWGFFSQYGPIGILALAFGVLLFRCIKKQDAREERLAEVVEASTRTMAVVLDRHENR